MSRCNLPPQSLGVIAPVGSPGHTLTGADLFRFPERVPLLPCWQRTLSRTPPGPLYSSAPVRVCPNDSEDIASLRDISSGDRPRCPGINAPARHGRNRQRRWEALFSPLSLFNSIPQSGNSPTLRKPAFLRLSDQSHLSRSPFGCRAKGLARDPEPASIGGRSPLASTALPGGPPLRFGPAGDPSAHPPGMSAYRRSRRIAAGGVNLRPRPTSTEGAGPYD